MREMLGSRPKNRITVVHLVESCRGGVGTFVTNLIRSQTADPDITAVHLVFDPNLTGEMLNDVPAQRHPYRSSRSVAGQIEVARQVTRIFQSIHPDIVFLHATFPGVYGRLLSPVTPWTRVYCAHGWAFCQDVPPAKRLAYVLVERALSRRCEAIIDISASEHAAARQAGITAPIHRHIPNGLPASRSVASAEIGSKRERINLGFIGRFDRQKGVDILLDIFSDPELSHIDLWLIGENVRDGGVTLPTAPNIHLLGWISNAVLDDYIVNFDAVVVPSRWEGFGLVALEAMRNARPAIVSGVGGLREIVVHERNGLVMDIRDVSACRRLFSALTKRSLEMMGKAALELFERDYHWDICYARWKEVGEEAVEQLTSRP